MISFKAADGGGAAVSLLAFFKDFQNQNTKILVLFLFDSKASIGFH